MAETFKKITGEIVEISTIQTVKRLVSIAELEAQAAYYLNAISSNQAAVTLNTKLLNEVKAQIVEAKKTLK